MDLFNSLESWHWLILSFSLLGAETLGAGGFLLGSAAAAALVGVVLWLIPTLGWTEQFTLFGIFSLLLTIAYWKLFKKVNNENNYPNLNNRASQLIGRVFELDQDISPGYQKKVQIGDTLWKVQSSKLLLKGSLAEVVNSQDMLLILEEKKV